PPPDCRTEERDGVLEITNNQNGCGRWTALGHDLIGGAVSIEITRPGSGEPDLLFALEVGPPAGEVIAFHYSNVAAVPRLQGHRLAFGAEPGEGAELFDVPFVAADHRVWRFRHAG